MENDAPRFATVQHGVPLLSEMATQRHLATNARPDPRKTANPIRQRGTIQRCRKSKYE